MTPQLSTSEKHAIQLKISQIIEKSRHHEESFLVDSKTAAIDILRYLHIENLIVLPVSD